MRNITLAIAALAAIAFVLPVIPASAKDAVIIRRPITTVTGNAITATRKLWCCTTRELWC